MSPAYLAERTALLPQFRPDAVNDVVVTSADVQSAKLALRKSMHAALLEDPQREVWTPGFKDADGGRDKATAADVFTMALGEERTHELMRLLADAAKGADIQIRAACQLSIIAAEYANFHALDAARHEVQA